MCGILAVVGGPLPVDDDRAGAALDVLTHRGPDDRGVWSSEDAWLGSRRLAVLDTSLRGHQPMEHESGVVLAFNGEIYNFVELRAELEQAGAAFASGSDTEVVLQAYLAWGAACVERFNGMWALALWDARSRTALVSRDRFGVKPLYATWARGRVSVASEPKALLHLYPELRRVDERTLFEFLAYGRLHGGDRSFYEGIAAVPPATTWTIGRDGALREERRFWSYPEVGTERGDDLPERFSELFEDAVRIRMRSDVPVAVSLSGGLDSTAVVHAAAQHLDGGPPLHAFTSIFDGVRGAARDEREWAHEASRHYPRVVLEQVAAADGDWRNVLMRAAWHLDAPNYSPAIIPLWAIMRRAHERGVKVMLEGQGGDELLGGYTHYAALALLDRFIGRERAPAAALREFRAYASAFSPTTFALWLAREAVPPVRNAYRERLGTAATLRRSFRAGHSDVTAPPAPSRDLGTRLVGDFSRDILPALLHYGDAISSAHSVESRQPFLDYRLVELCVALPARLKVAEGETKRVLRSYLRSIGHERIAARTDKLGFPTPIWEWLAGGDAAVSRELLLSPESRVLAYCTRAGIERLIERTRRKPETGAAHLYRLVGTEAWLRSCFA
jgi:asparagine synthase (glutamine-hydrolysing)